MNLDFNKKYIFSDKFDLIENNDDYLYIDYENVIWLRTNSTGKELVSMCKGELTLEDIIKILGDKYGFPPNVLKHNMESFFAKVIEKGIIAEEINEKEMEYIHPDFPVDIWIHVTGKCNLTCPFCYSHSGMDKDDIDLKSVLNFLEQIPLEKRKNIFISGGEPFLYKELPQFVKAINEMEFEQIILITNGTVGEDIYQDVLPYITSLQISVDGTVKEVHEKTRGEGNFEKVLQKFKLAREIGVKNLFISFTPTKYNVEDLPNIPKFAMDNNIEHVHVTRLIPAGRGELNKKSISPEEDKFFENIEKYIENIRKVNSTIYYIRETDEMFLEEDKKRKFIGTSIASDQSDKVIMGAKRKTCGLGTILSINHDGNVYICPSICKEEFLLGNINSNNYEDIRIKNTEFSKMLCVENLSEECRTCKLKYFCGGGCRACALAEGDIYGMDSSCSLYKESIMETMWNFRNAPVED